jgi:hypothetical protein
MQTAKRRLSSWAVMASVLAHLGVLTAVLLQHPTLTIPVEPGGPPQAIIPVLILPRTPAPAAGRGAKPTPIQLHRRSLRNLPPQTPVAPLILPAAKPLPAQAQATAPAAARDPAQPPPPSDALRASLRTTLGCNVAQLSRDERAACFERLGRGAHDAPYLRQPLAAGKRADLDETGAAKLAARAWPELGPGRPGTPPREADYSGNPYMSGAGQDIVGPVNLPPSKRAAEKLGPLPP